MFSETKSLDIKIDNQIISLKITPLKHSSSEAVQIAGRFYSINYGNTQLTPVVEKIVKEVLSQPLQNVEQFENNLRTRISLMTEKTMIGLPLQAEVQSTSSIEKKELDQILSKEIVSNYLEKLKNCSYFSGVVKVNFSDGTTMTMTNKGFLPDQSFDANTIFNVMSVGKLFTAIAIMQLFEQGKIELDDPINQYLTAEDLELRDADPMYIQDMGFQKDEEKARFFEEVQKSSISVRDLLTHTAGLIKENQKYRFDPKEKGKYNYSNYGYQLLARLIERQSELSFVEYVQKNIFTRPGHEEEMIMPTALSCSQKPLHQEPDPLYVYKKELFRVEEPIRVPKSDGNGCWWMNVDDLLRFAKAFMDNKYISSESKQAMLTPALFRTPDGFLQQGLGFVLSPGKSDEPAAFANQGSLDGRSALISTIYDKNTTLIIAALCNCDSGSNFFADLIQMARGREISKPLSYLEEEGEATEEALRWLLKADATNQEVIRKYLKKKNIPYHLWKVMANELKPQRPDMAKILSSL